MNEFINKYSELLFDLEIYNDNLYKFIFKYKEMDMIKDWILNEQLIAAGYSEIARLKYAN